MPLGITHPDAGPFTDFTSEQTAWRNVHTVAGFILDALSSFTNVTGASLNSLITTASPITLATSDNSGAAADRVFPLTVRGAGSPQLELNGDGIWASSRNAITGDTVKLRLTSANAGTTARTATLYADGRSTTWSVTTGVVFTLAGVTGYAFHIDPSDSASVTLVSSAVSQVDDKSGNGYHATQVTSGSRGTVSAAALNGLDVLYMASGKSLNIPSGFLTACNAGDKVSFFCLCKATATGGYIPVFDTASRQLSVFGDSGAAAISYVGAGGASSGPTGATAWSYNAWHLVEIICDGTNAHIYVDGKGTATKLQTGTFTDAISLGANPSGGGTNPIAYYAEIVGYVGDLGTTDRQKVEGFLAWKWGINTNLDPSHPYYSSPP